MKLLFLTHRLPCPPDRGCKLRSAVLLHWLARRHDVWCAGFLDAERDAVRQREAGLSLAALRRTCRDVASIPLHRTAGLARAIMGLAAGSTATESCFTSPRLERTVLEWARRIGFDAVLAFSSSMAPLALRVPARRRVLCMDDLDSRKWEELASCARRPLSWVYGTEARRLAARERRWIASFDATALVSEREARLVTDRLLRDRVHVIPAGTPLDIDADEIEPRAPLTEEPIVGFVGAMDYGPNIEAAEWFAEAVWPIVRRCRNDAQWWIVGRSPSRAVRRLAEIEGVRVTGTVPAIGPYLAAMRVHVAPLRVARGVQIKVLAAMAAGRPCVVTSGVAEGIGAEPGRDLLVADDAAAFARAVSDLLMDRTRATAFAASGRDFVDRRLRSDEGLLRLERLLGGVEGQVRNVECAARGIESLVSCA